MTNLHARITLFTLLLLTIAAASSLGSQDSDGPAPDARARWFKGNTHTHTYWSDGNASPEHVAAWYVEHGYHFLVLSDHNILSQGEKWFPIGDEGNRPLRQSDVDDLEERFGPGWVVTRERDGTKEMRLKTLPELQARFEKEDQFIFIQGEEISDNFRRLPVHINAMNIDEVIEPQGGESLREVIQRNIDAVIAQGERLNRPVLAHINHPNFQHALTPEDVASVAGERFFEVYNGHRGVLTNGDERSVSMEVLWDVALHLRLTEFNLGLLYGVATDDSHNHHGRNETSVPGRGWVWVRANELTPDAIVQAMRDGAFYASSGVELADFGSTSSSLWLEIKPEEGVTYTTEFIGTRKPADGETPEIGEVLATSTELRPTYTFTGDEMHVRARVTSSREHPNPFEEGDHEMAWVQPVLNTRAAP